VLSLCSPVLHRAICGGFEECITKRINLESVDRQSFDEILSLWCGEASILKNKDVDELFALAMLADRFEISDVGIALEDCIIRHMKAETCTDMLIRSESAGLRRVADAARRLAADQFERWCGTDALLRLPEPELTRVLDDDRLVARGEEPVLHTGCMRSST
jgi:hypothetical protein